MGATLAPNNHWESIHLPIAAPSQQLGAPSTRNKDPEAVAVRFNGGILSTQGQGPIGDLTRFTLEALVHPEWDLIHERDFYCVIDYSHFVPGLGSNGPNRNAGFAVYAGSSGLEQATNSPAPILSAAHPYRSCRSMIPISPFSSAILRRFCGSIR